ncbi:phosphoribosylglycinamide formyltransferase [Sansalvadorimonas sp. 2012CJ34-2]|uniref:Phosphoribosylglycinamide formyltransferase n=1 Tax=Parendozoicomonas callyspongiae TaxID=2942213 RepID=A0ABT0PH16_9GAMM|nr:phosphoribosylglycinamide formyltransferase [Sansalvadorimonas sp. 2012CJ34-2]MCL6270669.1 phosphoribosylglycinamide formyltransferase [Sansalvadorimonas sp. 2012CJ34-2]
MTTVNKPAIPIVVLISGSGSNLQALIDTQDDTNIRIAAVISNQQGVRGLERAQEAGIPAIVLNHTEYDSREAFDQALISEIDSHQPELVILAGFMRILTPEMTNHYHGRMMNIHPSLLPKYKGLHTHKRALEAGDNVHGVTVHFVSSELDGGPPIIQARVPVKATDNQESLQKRVLLQEHIIYPVAVGWFAAGRLKLDGDTAILDDRPLPPSGFQHISQHTSISTPL